MPTESVCGADDLGNALFTALVPAQANPVTAPQPIDNAALTTIALDGTGVFDVLMRAFKVHLLEEYTAGRISGDQYTKAYIAMTTAAMQQSVQFLLGRDQAYHQGLLIAQQAENARAQLAQLKMQMAVADAQYCLVVEQKEAKRAETMDTRSDGVTAIMGSIGKQKELYTQQIDSYQKDAVYKVGKLWSDAWVAQKTLDEGMDAPDNYTNVEVDEVLKALRVGVGLEGDNIEPSP